MTNHIFSDVNRYMPTTIMYSDGVTNHLREDGARPTPGTDHFLVTMLIHDFNFLQQFWVHKWTFFQRSSHTLISKRLQWLPSINSNCCSKIAPQPSFYLRFFPLCRTMYF